jgi:NAD(P)-dependent dehydrogenase (short-subunit alcohol dehydrogenase family)
MDKAYLESLFGLEGKVAAVTGGGGVLCGVMSRALGKLGVKVAVMDLREESAKQVAAEIVDQGGEAIGLACDVLDKACMQEACDAVLEQWGRVDILINGAGGNKKQATTSADLSEQGDGCILNVSSMSALAPLTRIPAYSAAKAAVSNFTQWLAVHIAQEYTPDVRVNALAPGFFLTEQNRFLLTEEATGELTPRGRTIIDHTPMGRFGDPDDLIGVTLWLLSPAASFVTGIVVPIDGGFSAFSGV